MRVVQESWRRRRLVRQRRRTCSAWKTASIGTSEREGIEMRTSLIAVAIAMAASAASAQGTQDSPNRTPLMFEVAARGYLSGGRTGSMAGDSASDRLDSYVWADQTLCGMGAG